MGIINFEIVGSDSNIFTIKRNDTLPELEIQVQTRGCLNQAIPYDLSAATACTFSMADSRGNLKISSMSGQVLTASAGTIQYNWVTGDTDESGKYQGEFEIFFSGGSKLSVPTIGSINIQVLNDLNGL